MQTMSNVAGVRARNNYGLATWSELTIAAELAKDGWFVAQPTQGCSWDLLAARYRTQWFTIQVKASRPRLSHGTGQRSLYRFKFPKKEFEAGVITNHVYALCFVRPCSVTEILVLPQSRLKEVLDEGRQGDNSNYYAYQVNIWLRKADIYCNGISLARDCVQSRKTWPFPAVRPEPDAITLAECDSALL